MSSLPDFPELEEKIASLEKRLAKLKRARNSHIRICQLPAEVLVEILKSAQHTTDLYDEDRPWLTFDPSWSRIMLVCSYFRKIAARTPALWTVLDYEHGSSQWRRLCIKRSGNSPFFLRGAGCEAMNYLSKAQAADMHDFDNCAKKCASGLNDLAPQLRVLNVSLFEKPTGFFARNPTPAVFKITSLFMSGGQTPLVSLTLHGNGLSLCDPPLMPQLRFLYLDSIRTAYDMTPFVLLFGRTPVLEKLSIVDICITEQFGSVEPTEIVTIPEHDVTPSSLKFLIIDDTPAEASALARMLIPHQSGVAMRIIIKSWLQYDEDEDTDEEDPFETTELNDNYLSTYEAWRTHARNHGSAPISGSISYNVPYRAHYGINIRFESSDSTLSMTCSVRMNTTTSPLFDDVTTLHLIWHCDQLSFQENETVFVIDALTHLSHLRTLVLVEYNLVTTVHKVALKCWIETLPQLEHVQFVRCDSSTRPFMEELVAESLVRLVSWSDR